MINVEPNLKNVEGTGSIVVISSTDYKLTEDTVVNFDASGVFSSF